MSAKKIACLGGGSFYYPRLLPEILACDELSGSEIALYDIVPEKAERMAAKMHQLAEEAGTGCRVRASADLGDTLDGADFAVSSIGGSGAGVAHRMAHTSYWHTMDVQIAV